MTNIPFKTESYEQWNVRNEKAKKHGRRVKPFPVTIDISLLNEAIDAVIALQDEYNDSLAYVQTRDETASLKFKVAMLAQLESKLINLKPKGA